MPRQPRFWFPGTVLHVVQRGNNRAQVFVNDDDRHRYVDDLLAASRKHHVAVHAYVLMTNHVHLLATPIAADAMPRTMQTVGRRYVDRFDRVHSRTGTLWEGRYKAPLVDTDRYFFSCMRYIELNLPAPVVRRAAEAEVLHAVAVAPCMDFAVLAGHPPPVANSPDACRATLMLTRVLMPKDGKARYGHQYGAPMKSQTIPTVRTYMDRETHALSADDDIVDAVGRLIDEGVTGAPVVDDKGHVVGLLSEFDCLRLLAKGSDGERASGQVRDFMSTEFTTVPPTMDVYYVAGMFLRDPAHRRFIVLEGPQLVGVVTRKDILRAVRAGLGGR